MGILTQTGDLDAHALFNAAARECGLESYSDDGIHERFVDLIGKFNEFGKIPEHALEPAIAELKRAVEIRLEIARDWAEHPEILDEKIIKPIFVVGNARAGTTITQSLLTLDEGHRTPRFVDALHPSPPPGFDPDADAIALRASDAYVTFMMEREPRLLIAHPYHDKLGMAEAEDEFIHSLDFGSVYPLHFQRVPTVPTTFPPADPLRAFAFHKNMLRHLQWKRPTRRWVGKGINHQYNIGPLLQTFDDAVAVWIHRPPEQLVASFIAIYEIVYRPMYGDRFSMSSEDMVTALRSGVDHILNDPAVNDARISHIRFPDLMKDPIAVIASVYEQHGLDFTARYEARLKKRLADPAHRVDRHGKFHYSGSDYGIDDARMKRIFADYSERFGL